MLAVVLAIMTFCPLSSGGILPSSVSASSDGAKAQSYTVYISNPSPFDLVTSRIDVWMKDTPNGKTAHAVPEDFARTTVRAHKNVTIPFQDITLDLHDGVGSTIECDGIK